MLSHSINRWDALKIIGLLLMFVDHAGYFYFPEHEWLRGIGRGAAVIFFFLTGLTPHYRFSRELLLLAAALTLFDWVNIAGINTLNILWSILICRAVLSWVERRGKNPPLHEWVIACLVLVPSVLITQYGTLGMLLALAGYVTKRTDLYSAKTQRNFLLLSLAIFAIAHSLLSEFAMLTNLTMAITLTGTFMLLTWLSASPTAPVMESSLLRIAARYSAYIYVLHLMLLGWLTGMPL